MKNRATTGGFFGALVSVVALAAVSASMLGLTGSSGADSFGSSVMSLRETQGSVVCDSTSSSPCAINLLQGKPVGGAGSQMSQSQVTITNTGSGAGVVLLNGGPCSATVQSGSDNGFCGKVDVSVEGVKGHTIRCALPASAQACHAPSSAATLATLSQANAALLPLGPGESETVYLTFAEDSSATGADSGAQASMDLSWSTSQ